MATGEISQEDIEAQSRIQGTLHHLARKIVELGIETPALFFLELQKPVTTLLHTSTLLFSPIATPFFGLERIQSFQLLLSERKNIDDLMGLINSYSSAKQSKRGQN